MNENYRYHTIDLGKERQKDANSVLAPWSIQTKLDFIVVLTLTGTASLSVDHGDYFPLTQKMRVYLGGKRKFIQIINSAQEGKFLKLLISRKTDLEVVKT